MVLGYLTNKFWWQKRCSTFSEKWDVWCTLFPSSNLTSATKISEKSVEKLSRKLRFSDVVFRRFGSKIGKCLKAATIFSFEVRRNRKTPNGEESNALQNGYLVFLIFFEFDPKTQNLDFSKIIAYKIQFFYDIKNGIHSINIHTRNIHTQFQSNIFIFGCAMAKNQVRVMSLFETQFLVFLIVVHKNESHFSNP